MFTPPPSPLPTAGVSQFADAQTSSAKGHLLSPPQPQHAPPQHLAPLKQPPTEKKSRQTAHSVQDDAKRRTGRRFRYAVLLVPCVLVAITVTARFITQGAPTVLSSLTFADTLHFGLSWPPNQSPSPCPMLVAPEPLQPHPRVHPHKVHRHGHHKRSPHPANNGLPLSQSSGAATPTTTSRSSTKDVIPTVPATPPTLPTPFPQSFDGVLSKNFTTVSCYNFFANMTASTNFRSCRPFSMLMQTSDTFLEAQSNVTLLNNLIWGTCNTLTSQEQCITNMEKYAADLQVQCAQELKEHHATASDTLIALDAYAVMRSSACLTDPTTNTYCFVNAARDTNPTNLYYYSLPLGLKLPSSSDPQCTACLKSLMSLYTSAAKAAVKAGEEKLAGLRKTYEKAAELTQGKCGAGYAALGVVGAGMKERANVVGMLVGLLVISLGLVHGW